MFGYAEEHASKQLIKTENAHNNVFKYSQENIYSNDIFCITQKNLIQLLSLPPSTFLS